MCDCWLNAKLTMFISWRELSTSYILKRWWWWWWWWWWWSLCTRPIHWVDFWNWNNSPRVDMSLHSDTLSWLWANQSLLVLFSVVCLAEKQQIPILYSLVWPDRSSNPRFIALESSTLTITPPMRSKFSCSNNTTGILYIKSVNIIHSF